MIVKFISFGCKVNLTETEYMKNTFARAGFTIASSGNADVFVVNSCTVTDTADSKLKKTLRQLRRDHPGAIIAVTGCYPEAHPGESALIGADIMTGTRERAMLPEIIRGFIADRSYLYNPVVSAKTFEDFSVTRFEGNTRAFLKIQDGCDMNCSYCIIPQSRGHFRSKPLESLKKDAAAICANGYREIVLTGINLAFYGIEHGLRLIDGVEAVADAAPGVRIRLGSLEPEKLSEADIKRLAAIPGLCPQFHLSLQSACDSTLARMKRRYNVGEYMELVGMFRGFFPGCAITTDVMVGFPGETDVEFNDTCENLEAVGFADMHIFPFSRRSGTVADTLPDQLTEAVKQYRARVVAEIAAHSRRVYHESMVGKVVNVLFEREKPSDDIKSPHGFAENYVKVTLPGVKLSPDETYKNRILPVKITGVYGDGVVGEELH